MILPDEKRLRALGVEPGDLDSVVSALVAVAERQREALWRIAANIKHDGNLGGYCDNGCGMSAREAYGEDDFCTRLVEEGLCDGL